MLRRAFVSAYTSSDADGSTGLQKLCLFIAPFVGTGEGMQELDALIRWRSRPGLMHNQFWPVLRRGRCGQRRRPPRQQAPPRWRRRRSQTAGAGPVWRPSHPDVGKIMCWAVPVKSGAGGNDDICAVALGGHVETRPQAVGVAFQSLL